MKITAINGSPRKNGNTDELLRLFKKTIHAQAGSEPVEFDIISLADNALQFCRGCRACFDRGEQACPLQDELPDIYRRLLDSDGVIIAGPVYVEDVSGTLKNFIDRMAFNCHRPAFAGKPAMTLLTAGMGASGHPLRTVGFALRSWGFRVSARYTFKMGARMSREDAGQVYTAQAAKLCLCFIGDILGNKPLRPSFYNLLVFKVQQMSYRDGANYQGTYDQAYWQQRGWLEPGCTYFTHHKSNPLKVLAARLVGGIVGKMMI